MKKMLAALLSLLLLLSALPFPALADVVTIDTETATCEEIAAACELLKAARIARLKENFAQTHEVQPLDGITFRGVPWGSTRADAEAIVGPAVSSTPMITVRRSTVNSDGIGVRTIYKNWTIAGYPAYTAEFNYVYPVMDGEMLRDDNLAILYLGEYQFWDLGDVSAVMEDLTTKLSGLYGAYAIANGGRRTWTDAQGNSIELSYAGSRVYLLYISAQAEADLGAAKAVLAAERAEQEELLRIQNQNNTDGL